jgi:TrpR family trp operon transcriptional repressor
MISKSISKIVKEIQKLQSEEDIRDFLLGVLTPGEIEEIAQRIEIIKMLKQGVNQHEIAGKLGVGVATVTRGSKELKLGRFKTV